MDVDSILKARAAEYKTTDVSKEVELQYDLGNLLATDLNPLDEGALSSRDSREEYLRGVARDSTQLLLNQLWELPVSKEEGFVLAELPSCVTVLPREKPIPQPKAPTRWELFAKSKGIKKVKRSRMVFDEKSQEWKPRWGYKRINDPQDDWCLEVPENSDPFEDQFEKRRKKTDESVAKNEYQRLKNLARGMKGGKVKASLPPPGTKDLKKHQLTHAMGMAKKATASVGKFTPSLPKEPTARRAKKRNFDPVAGNFAAEKKRNLDILEKLGKKKPVLDVKKATNAHIAAEERQGGGRVGASGDGKSGKRVKRSKMGGGKKSQGSASKLSRRGKITAKKFKKGK